jgi:hypothetical protein
MKVNGGDSKKYDLEVKEATFWEAMQKIQQLTDYTIARYSYDKQFTLEKAQGMSPYIVNHGPVRLEVTHLHEDRDAFFADTAKDGKSTRLTHQLTMTFKAISEPRHGILDMHAIKVEKALDDDKNSFTTPKETNTGQRYNDRYGALFACETKLLLQRSNPSSKAVRQLTGTVPVDLIIEKKPVIVSDDLAKANGTKFRVGNYTLEVTRAEISPSGGNIEIRIPPDQNQNENNWHGRMILEDVNGQRFADHGRGSSSSGNGDRRVSVYFGNPGKLAAPKRFIVEDWITVLYPVPFEFKDIPLP